MNKLDRIREAALLGLSATRIAAELDITRSSVLGLARRNGIKFYGNARIKRPKPGKTNNAWAYSKTPL